jgi:Mrp family chromosome partitioning ATPase
MEVSYIRSAIRRYWWIVLLLCLAGTVGVSKKFGSADTVYESRAVLSLTPSSRQVQAGTLGSDRYVAGQVAVLRSESLAQGVATAVGSPNDSVGIAHSLAVTSSLGSDAVTVEVSAPTPERAQQLAAAYVTSYFDKLKADEQAYSEGATKQLQPEITSITGQLAALDTQIATAMARYLPSSTDISGRSVIPSVEQIAPDLATQKAQLLTQINELTTRQTQLQIQQLNDINSSVIQAATLPPSADAKSKVLFAGAGLLAGAFLGILAAVVIARLSPRVLDAQHAEEILGTAVLDGLPRSYQQAGDLVPPLFAPRSAARFVDRLCVHAESCPRRRDALTVAVVGSQRGSGTTAIAGAMAERFAAYGASVLLVDANPRHRELTERFDADAPGLESLSMTPGLSGTIGAPAHVENLSFVGLTTSGDAAVLRRNDARDLLDLVSAGDAEVVVIDAGSLREVSSSLRLAFAADVVVLTIPVEREDTDNLRWISHELRDQADHLLPVSVPLRNRSSLARAVSWSRRLASRLAPQPSDLDDGDETTESTSHSDDTISLPDDESLSDQIDRPRTPAPLK